MIYKYAMAQFKQDQNNDLSLALHDHKWFERGGATLPLYEELLAAMTLFRV